MRGFSMRKCYLSWRLSREAFRTGSFSCPWCSSSPRALPCGQLRPSPATSRIGSWTLHGSLWLCAICHWKSETLKQSKSINITLPQRRFMDVAKEDLHRRMQSIADPLIYQKQWKPSLRKRHTPFGHPNPEVKAAPHCLLSRASVGLQTRQRSSTKNYGRKELHVRIYKIMFSTNHSFNWK